MNEFEKFPGICQGWLTAKEHQEVKDRALKRQFLAQIGHCPIADSIKSLGQFEAEELIKIRAARIEKEAEAAASEAYAGAAARGAGKARPPVFEAPALAPEPQDAPESAEHRQARRYQLCIDARLIMPTDDYAHLPRGIGKLAESEGITRQAFSEDVKAHIRRMRHR